MRIIGYSERGAVNALLYEIAYAPNSAELLQRLLARARFPLAGGPGPVETATVLMEQSLSDFGDADAILLLDGSGGKSAVFLEAKVKGFGEALENPRGVRQVPRCPAVDPALLQPLPMRGGR
jgi:hypothetical protein